MGGERGRRGLLRLPEGPPSQPCARWGWEPGPELALPTCHCGSESRRPFLRRFWTLCAVLPFLPKCRSTPRTRPIFPPASGPPSVPSQEGQPQGGSGLGSGSREMVHRTSEMDGLQYVAQAWAVRNRHPRPRGHYTPSLEASVIPWGPSSKHLLEPEPLEDSKSWRAPTVCSCWGGGEGGARHVPQEQQPDTAQLSAPPSGQQSDSLSGRVEVVGAGGSPRVPASGPRLHPACGFRVQGP